MASINGVTHTMLEKLRKAVADNLTRNQFGVETLAREVGMSRSQLHRKLHTATGQSVSQFIREYRLQLGMEMLKKGDLTAAEVADRVGFGSATYFNKCFHEYYGFPPGEAKTKAADPANKVVSDPLINATDRGAGPRSAFAIILVAAAALMLVGWVSFTFSQRVKEGVTGSGKSIAVLPFRNLSTHPGNEYFSEGVMEAIRTDLSQVGDLHVVSRTSVEQYRESDKSARQIASELGVIALLEGSIQRNINHVRVDVRLVDGATGGLVWATSFDRELKDVFAIQREIAKRVVTELNAELTDDEKSKLSRTDTDDLKAYDMYLKAVFEYRTYTNEGAHNAIELLRQVIALDSGYARAYALMASSYNGLATIFGAELGALEALEKGKQFIDKALALDPNLDEAHMLMGFYRLYHDWDFDGAETSYKRALASDHPDAIALYVDYLNFMSRHEEALMWAERLNRSDPYYPNSRLVQSYVSNGRFDEAMDFSTTRLKMFNNYLTFDAHGFLLLRLGRYQEAMVYFKKAIALEGIRYPRMLGWMGAAYAKGGEPQKARAIINELKARLAKNEKGSIAFFIAVVYSALNDKEAALTWLKTACDSHDMEMPWLMTEPQFFNLHEEPEFQRLAARIGFS